MSRGLEDALSMRRSLKTTHSHSGLAAGGSPADQVRLHLQGPSDPHHNRILSSFSALDVCALDTCNENQPDLTS